MLRFIGRLVVAIIAMAAMRALLKVSPWAVCFIASVGIIVLVDIVMDRGEDWR